MAKLVKIYLWFNSQTGQLDTSSQTRILESTFLNWGVSGLGVSDWRQASVAIADMFLKESTRIARGDDGEDEDEGNDFFDLQRNHSTRTANIAYGGTSGFGLDRETEAGYMRASEEWQKFWGVRWEHELDPLAVEQVSFDPAVLALEGLKIFTKNPAAQWKSDFQCGWILEVIQGVSDLLIVAKTGGGKSLAYLIPPLVETKGVTVVIQPLKALALETVDIAAKNNINHILFDRGIDNISPLTRLVIASVEHASQPRLSQLLERIKVNRVIIDEAHQYLDDQEFRNYMAGVAGMRRLQCPFVFTTGSLAATQEHRLLGQLFNLCSVKTHREITFRKELHFNVDSTKIRHLRQLVPLVKLHSQKYMGTEYTSRALVFIENRSEVEELAEMLQNDGFGFVFKYHAHLDSDERQLQIRNWRNSRDQAIMVSTSAFGAGINCPGVRFVIIVGLPKESEINRAYQEAGRAGRDGHDAWVTFVKRWTDQEPDSLQVQLSNPGVCAASVFAERLDATRITCSSALSRIKCTACQGSDNSEQHQDLDQGTFARHNNLESSNMNVHQSASQQSTSRTLVEANQVHASRSLALAEKSANNIFQLGKKLRGGCGWCWGKYRKVAVHSHQACPELRSLCFICCGKCRTYKDCQVKRFRDVLKVSYGSTICYFCGLPTGYRNQITFHNSREKGACDSGWKDTCGQLAWYLYYHEKALVQEVMQISNISTAQYAEWMGMKGSYGWAKVYDLLLKYFEQLTRR